MRGADSALKESAVTDTERAEAIKMLIDAALALERIVGLTPKERLDAQKKLIAGALAFVLTTLR